MSVSSDQISKDLNDNYLMKVIREVNSKIQNIHTSNRYSEEQLDEEEWDLRIIQHMDLTSGRELNPYFMGFYEFTAKLAAQTELLKAGNCSPQSSLAQYNFLETFSKSQEGENYTVMPCKSNVSFVLFKLLQGTESYDTSHIFLLIRNKKTNEEYLYCPWSEISGPNTPETVEKIMRDVIKQIKAKMQKKSDKVGLTLIEKYETSQALKDDCQSKPYSEYYTESGPEHLQHFKAEVKDFPRLQVEKETRLIEALVNAMKNPELLHKYFSKEDVEYLITTAYERIQIYQNNNYQNDIMWYQKHNRPYDEKEVRKLWCKCLLTDEQKDLLKKEYNISDKPLLREIQEIHVDNSVLLHDQQNISGNDELETKNPIKQKTTNRLTPEINNNIKISNNRYAFHKPIAAAPSIIYNGCTKASEDSKRKHFIEDEIQKFITKNYLNNEKVTCTVDKNADKTFYEIKKGNTSALLIYQKNKLFPNAIWVNDENKKPLVKKTQIPDDKNYIKNLTEVLEEAFNHVSSKHQPAMKP